MENIKKNRIGILTFSPDSLNPGTIFQSWSLLHFINSLPGFEAEQIYYECWKRNLFKHGLPSLPNFWFKYTLWRSGSFQKRNIKKYPLKKALVRENISSINGRYDMVILGSDQVWNPKLTGYDKSYFLDFVKGAKKAAYAPSIGIPDWPEEIKSEIKGFLEDFEFIGVREKTAVPIVQALTNKLVHWSLDPTFLVNSTEWGQVAFAPKEKKDGFIMEYCLQKNPLLVKAIDKATKEFNIPAIECYGGRKRVPSAIKKHNVGADKWLGYILNAKVVITDSFHAVAFCINNNRPFYAILSANGNRIVSVLNLFGLQDRLINKEEDIDFTKEIDWEPVNQKLEELRGENQTWLKESLLESLNR